MAVIETLEQRLARHEGVRSKPYLDPAGKLTIGVGRNLTDNGLSVDEIETLLHHDIAAARYWVGRYLPWTLTLDSVRQDVFTELVFNMGIGTLLAFHHLLDAAKRGDWTTAAAELRDSSYARQVGARATELATLLQKGS